MPTGVGAATFELDLRGLRWAGAAMLTAATAWPLLPARTGIPCGLMTLTGVPCPLCGMTRSVIDTVHFRVDEAFATNPAGILAVVLALVLLLLSRSRSAMTLPRWSIPAGVAALWAFQLLRLPFT